MDRMPYDAKSVVMVQRVVLRISSSFLLLCSVLLVNTHTVDCFADLADERSLSVAEVRQVGNPDIRPLIAGEWVEVVPTPPGLNFFEFDLRPGEATQIELRSLLVTASVWGPGNEKFALPTEELPAYVADVFQAQTRFNEGMEPLIVVSDLGGKYRLRVSSGRKYSVRYVTPRRATERDRKYMEAARLEFEIAAAGSRRSYESVLLHLDQRTRIYTELGDDQSIALSLYRNSLIYSAIGELQKSIDSRYRSRDIFDRINWKEPAYYSFPCFAFEGLGDFQSMIGCLEEQLAYAKSTGQILLQASAFHALGAAYHRLADEDKARIYYESSLALKQSVRPETVQSLGNQINTYGNLGNLARGMNAGEVPIEFFPKRTHTDYERALEPLMKALEISRKTDSNQTNFILRQIGNTYRELGRYVDAVTYLEQSITGFRRINDPGAALAKADLARVHIAQGDNQKGLLMLDEVLPELSAAGYLSAFAAEYAKAGKPDRSRELFAQALAAHRKRNNLPKMANIHHGMAVVERDLGNFDNARRHILESIEIADSLRNRITNDEIRSVYFSAVKKYYDFYIDLLMQAHKAQPEKQYDRLAYEMSERARSRNLVDLLKLSGVDIRKGVDAGLLCKEKELRKQFAEKAAFETRLLRGRSTTEQVAKARKEVEEATESLGRIEAEIRKKSPSYAAVTQPSNPSLKQVQELLDPGTVMLAYTLGESKSYLWIISPDSLQSSELSSKREIDGHARAFHVAVSSPNAQERTLLPVVAEKLSRLLIGPAAQAIKNKRVVVVPDGSLNYVSFAGLTAPSSEPSTNPIPLAQLHEIVTLPSAGTLSILRHERASRRAPRPMAVFADPVFEASDARANVQVRRLVPNGSSPKETPAVVRDLDLALAGAGIGRGLPRLPFSRREADAIFDVLPDRLGIKKIDFQATKDAVFTSGLDQYRIVHFATHGLIDSRNPALSGLVLSLIDRKGNDVDGFLRLQDIYNLKLNADLVVLSACNTALGKEVRSEGIVGLTRGFMYAGTPRVVASLWKVDDAATAYFMSIFYRKMLVENMRPAAALRAAQMEMMKQPRWRSPYYWAPFVLQGEWK